MDTLQVDLPSGPIRYRDTGGAGPVVVLLHGLMMDFHLWDQVISELGSSVRCLAPTLPMGAHTTPSTDADLSLPGLARLVQAFLQQLDLHDVTLIGNDTGGAVVQLVAASGEPRVGRIALLSCEAFDNLPPGLTGRTLAAASHLSAGLFGAFMQQLRVKLVRRLPISFGWLTKRGDDVVVGWIQPVLSSAATRRDTVRMLRAVFADRRVLLGVVPALQRFTRPALVIWAREDRVMPLEHGRRLAALLPAAQLVEVDDSYTLLPLDQPAVIARAVRAFLADATVPPASR